MNSLKKYFLFHEEDTNTPPLGFNKYTNHSTTILFSSLKPNSITLEMHFISSRCFL